MSEPLTRHQVFEYQKDEPYVIQYARNDNDNSISQKNLLNHWHEELEIAYIIGGASRHYIDGKCICAAPGRAVVINCGCIHNIIVDEVPEEADGLRCIVLLISKEFIEEHFPEYQSIMFTNEKEQADPEFVELLMKLTQFYEAKEQVPFQSLCVRGLLLQILFCLCRQGTCLREDAEKINYQKNIERLRGVLQYVENHYTERITQAEIAEKFYFSKEYFSRFFKKCTGMTFMEHLTRFRLQKAKLELLETQNSILDIAMNNGFCDGRKFINTFKAEYNMTPFQYRKMINK